ncbi:MAG: apolipoprotein N-acyltransferase [Thalassospira sp.]|nr:apolipoprotein N-acyltransferase [Thalassospira sp.]
MVAGVATRRSRYGTAAAEECSFKPACMSETNAPLKAVTPPRGGVYMLLFTAGLLASLAMPPQGFVVFLLLFSICLWGMQRAATPLQGALSWGVFAYGFYLPQLTWIREALFVDAEQFGWLAIPAILGIPLYLSLFMAMAGAVYAALRPPLKYAAVTFAGLWGLTDYLQGHVAFSFPWAMPVYALDAVPILQQLHSVLGAYALNSLVVLWGCLPFLLLTKQWKQAVFWCICLFCALAWGQHRLNEYTNVSRETSGDIAIRLVQPNIEQHLKWDQTRVEENFYKVTALIETPYLDTAKPPRLVVLPEATIPLLLQNDANARTELTKTLVPGVFLALGGHRFEAGEYFNSMLVLSSAAEIIAYYDKHHLVPFGEYVPLRNILPLEAIAPLPGDFGRGKGALALKLAADMPRLWPLICYEAVFSGAVVTGNASDGVLVQITNDAWFGRSAGPYQHLAIARTRAIEEGLPMLRVANTGISAVIDPMGRIQASLALGEAGVLDAVIPPVYPALFPQYRWISWALPLLLVSSALILLARRSRHR